MANSSDFDSGQAYPTNERINEPEYHNPAENDGADEYDDIDVDEARPLGPRTKAEKRAAQNELFREFAARKEEQATKEKVKDILREVPDEQLSVRELLKKQETSSRILSARDYQMELYQRAKEQNIIAVLGTGSGKTHIATLLLRHVLELEVDARKKGKAHKTAFFLVNSVNLVFQQADVLDCGLDGHAVEGICGAMGANLWSKKTWTDHITKHMVIVCTAQVLLDCLMHSFIRIRDINILIFDEAHHTKNSHPYALLMREYYMKEMDPAFRPRVFGMTASPVDANTDVTKAALQLEKLLDCKIATTSDVALAANSINKPTEEVATYSVLSYPFETALYGELKNRYGHIHSFKGLFRKAGQLSSELGKWASDEYWAFAFTEEESQKREQRETLKYNRELSGTAAEELGKEILHFQQAAAYVRCHNNGVPSVTSEDLSSKVIRLHNYLMEYYGRHGNNRAIVFVNQRLTARLLHRIFQHIGGPYLRGGVLIGINNAVGDAKLSLNQQVRTVSGFRKGDINCIFATSVAEEGMDIPQCNLVVRFDLYTAMIGYVQSRGRARHQNSRYLHMVEEGNVDHRGRVVEALEAEKRMKAFCEGLSGDRLLDEPNRKLEDDLRLEDTLPQYIDPLTGAKLSYSSSLSVLSYFTSCLPTSNEEAQPQPHYVVVPSGFRNGFEGVERSGFQCEVILPESSPVTYMLGKVHRKKATARCSAAFEMCLELRKRGYLDEHLLTTIKKNSPAMAHALLAISEKKKDKYPMRTKPDIWKMDLGGIPQVLHLTIIDVDAGLDRPHQPIGLLTRVQLPEFPPFPIYLKNDRPSNVITVCLNNALQVTPETIELFTKFTLLVYEQMFNKVYDNDATKMYYWHVPVRCTLSSPMDPNTHPADIIDMDQIWATCQTPARKWSSDMSHQELAGRYIIDPTSGARRFYSIGVDPSKKALDPVPEDTPTFKYNENILGYSVSLWKKSRENAVWDHSQPVFSAEIIPFRRNYLAAIDNDEKKENRSNRKGIAYLCPEPLRISTLSVPLVAMFYVFPAIIHRLEDYLIALEASDILGIRVKPGLALEAVTKDSENTDEHGEEQINFKSGMGPNYERLEFLGDCFLKMATSISTFVLKPDENEFEFHVRRMVMLCNQNLFNAALELNLVEYIRTQAYSRRLWYPKLKMLSGKGVNSTGNEVIKHTLGDKSVADVCEALIGAAFLEHNVLGQWHHNMWDQAVKAVTRLVRKEDHLMEKYSDYYAAYNFPRYQLAEATAAQLDFAEKIEQLHPYHFRYPRLLRSAFIHPSQSFILENIPHYQRLEFLGDSLLDMAFIMHLVSLSKSDVDLAYNASSFTAILTRTLSGLQSTSRPWYPTSFWALSASSLASTDTSDIIIL